MRVHETGRGHHPSGKEAAMGAMPGPARRPRPVPSRELSPEEIADIARGQEICTREFLGGAAELLSEDRHMVGLVQRGEWERHVRRVAGLPADVANGERKSEPRSTNSIEIAPTDGTQRSLGGPR